MIIVFDKNDNIHNKNRLRQVLQQTKKTVLKKFFSKVDNNETGDCKCKKLKPIA